MSIEPGFYVIHSNRPELLRDMLIRWMKKYPVGPLENETILVQSNGMAQWLKLSLAEGSTGLGIASGLKFPMPGRFLWQCYRAVAGPDSLPETSPFDKERLIWRIMRVLPELLEHLKHGSDPAPDDPFLAVRRFLAGDSERQRTNRDSYSFQNLYRLSVTLADLYDQYQVYRADWLECWARGDRVTKIDGRATSAGCGSIQNSEQWKKDEIWQSLLWRALLASTVSDTAGPASDAPPGPALAGSAPAGSGASPDPAPTSQTGTDSGRPGTQFPGRADIHREFIKKAAGLDNPSQKPAGLPGRVMVFGISALPQQIVDVLYALSRCMQVMIFVNNPCRYYWGDICSDRELLAQLNRQFREQSGRDNGDFRRRHKRREELERLFADNAAEAAGDANLPSAEAANLPSAEAAGAAGLSPADSSSISLDDLIHQRANVLLASWGRQCRDYIAMLDQYDDPEDYRDLFRNWIDSWPNNLARLSYGQKARIDLFYPAEGENREEADGLEPSLLRDIQRDILELRPLSEIKNLYRESRNTKPAALEASAAPADSAVPEMPRAHVAPEDDCNSATIEPTPDDSITFHCAYSPMREVEILHDHLLEEFEKDRTLKPRDIMVMVPDINGYAPFIEAVFERFERTDNRYIPYTISDRRQRGENPVLVALESLLDIRESRFEASKILALLEIPAVMKRFGICLNDMEKIRNWVEGANIRWGLNASQRKDVGPDWVFEQNTWSVGLRRMLLGYCTGVSEPWQDIVPYEEIGGMDADLLGKLITFVESLEKLWKALGRERRAFDPAKQNAGPSGGREHFGLNSADHMDGAFQEEAAWQEVLNGLLEHFFAPVDTEDAMLLSRLRNNLDSLIVSIEDSGLDAYMPISVFREAWLGSMDAGGFTQQFMAGKVNFATLMPMRAIPFSRICLLGMNDSDYPRQSHSVDFDLMRGDYRPGDRSRRDDDRYLFLDALLSARKKLYISWTGRSMKDGSELGPSVLVEQLRDYIRARGVKPERLVIQHPMQPFSRKYLEPCDTMSGLDHRIFTYSKEMFVKDGDIEDISRNDSDLLPEAQVDNVVTLVDICQFLKRPVDLFYRKSLGLKMRKPEDMTMDIEPFDINGGQRWRMENQLLKEAMRLNLKTRQEHSAESGSDSGSFGDFASRHFQRLRLEGTMPCGASAEFMEEEFTELTEQVYSRWKSERAGALRAKGISFDNFADIEPVSREIEYEIEVPIIEVPIMGEGDAHTVRTIRIMGNIDSLYEIPVQGGIQGDSAHMPEYLRVAVTSSKIEEAGNKKVRKLRYDNLLEHWIYHLAANLLAKTESSVTGVKESAPPEDTVLKMRAVTARRAEELLANIISCYLFALRTPVPVAPKTAFAWMDKGDLEKARIKYEGSARFSTYPERDSSVSLAMRYPDFDAMLRPDFGFKEWAELLYRPAKNELDKAGAE